MSILWRKNSINGSQTDKLRIMMISLHNINSIAKYERKTLFRSWFFRIFSILSLVVLFFMNLGMVTEVGDASWIFRAIPSSIPYFNLLILNVAQAIIAVFLASDFLKRDKKLDTTEVIYMRSMTNGEYVIGKTMGNIQVFMVLNFAVLIMAMIFNFIAPDTHIPWISYLLYLLFISIPTLVFIMGLSFLLMSLIRNQAVTFVIILGYIGITLFLVKASYYYVFDYMAFNIPMLKSDIIGFGNLDLILGHRGIYFFLGTGFIFLTIFLLKRLPQSETTTWASVVLSVIFISAGVYLAFNHVNRFVTRDHVRAAAIELNNYYAKKPVPDVVRHDIKLRHKGETLESVSSMTLVNLTGQSMDSVVLSLNPGLVISASSLNGQAVQAVRKEQIVVFPLSSPLKPSESLKLELSYAGNIDESFCYLDIDSKKQDEKFGEFVINVDKRYAFLTPEYVLLTPESNWYPKPGSTYSSKIFGWNKTSFTDFNLVVNTSAGLQAISQGEITNPSPGEFIFKNENPLTQISLAIGKYVQKKMKTGSIEFGIWHFEGNDFFTTSLPDIKDTIPSLIEERFKDFQRTYNLNYPFKRFSIVEVPAQFKPYERVWTFQQETVQPEQVFLQEKGYKVRDVDVKMSMKREKKWGQHDGQSLTNKEYQIRAINNIIGNFIREGGRPNFNRQAGGTMQVTETVNPYFIFSELYHFSNHVRSDQWPVVDLVLEAYYKSQSSDMRSQWMREMGGLSEDEMANIALQDYSFEELLLNKDHQKIVDNLIKLKGDFLFTMIQSKAGDKDFTVFMRNLLRANQFRVLTFDSLDNRLVAEFGVAITPFMNNWFKDKKLPGFLISPVTAVNTKSVDQIRTMISFSASNTSDADGVIKLIFRLGGFGGGRGRMMGGASNPNDNITKILFLKPGETKKVSYLFDSEPRGLTINTLTSKNIPQTLAQFFGKVEEDLKAVPRDAEELTDVKVSDLQPNEIVVDNEDPEFSHTLNNKTSLLYKLVTKEQETGLKYAGFDNWRPAIKWTNTTNTGFYGLYVRSAYYIKSGAGDQSVTWTLPVKETGSYDIFTYVNPSFGRRGGFGPGQGGGGGNTEDKGEYHYFITHEDGVTEQTLQLDNNTQAGWNNLGSFYLSPQKAKIVLTNKSAKKIVVADAIKLVKN
jgi:ABC-type transport system involved in multi-copper enzyme maturation permease subunit